MPRATANPARPQEASSWQVLAGINQDKVRGEPDRRRGLRPGGSCHRRQRGRAQSMRIALAGRSHRDDPARGHFTQILGLAAACDRGNRAFIGRNQNRRRLGIKASVAAGELKHLSHERTGPHAETAAKRVRQSAQSPLTPNAPPPESSARPRGAWFPIRKPRSLSILGLVAFHSL
jgi:hypothetical protein